MIEPTKADIGRRVVYLAHHTTDREVGVISSFNEHLVFVRYGGKAQGEGTHRGNLEWDQGENSSAPISAADCGFDSIGKGFIFDVDAST